jgi:two-component system sensor histidine kinase YesM
MHPKELVLEDMNVEFDFAMFAAGIVIIVLVSVLLFQFMMFRPFFRINQTLHEIAAGDLTIRFKTNSQLKEIATLERSINHLLDEIQNLKINVYEMQLSERNVTCQYLNIRLKTHFYLNCLSIIHAMARVRNMELIKELTKCLSNYLRFLDRDANELVVLRDELTHVHNYARIQELRFPEMFQYIEDVAPELYNASIPPLILQTFFENSIEHAMIHGKKNWVCIHAYHELRSDLLGVRIFITDSGKGFDEATLQVLSDEPSQPDFKQRNSIGIRNVVSRLALIYDGKASIRFYNGETGAVIDMWLPIVNEDIKFLKNTVKDKN